MAGAIPADTLTYAQLDDGATDDPSQARLEILAAIQFLKTLAAAFDAGSKPWTDANDGPGTGLNADLLDGLQATAFALASHEHNAIQITSGIGAIQRGFTGRGTLTSYCLLYGLGTNPVGMLTPGTVQNAALISKGTGAPPQFVYRGNPIGGATYAKDGTISRNWGVLQNSATYASNPNYRFAVPLTGNSFGTNYRVDITPYLSFPNELTYAFANPDMVNRTASNLYVRTGRLASGLVHEAIEFSMTIWAD